jgi:hypothetical protein
VASLTAACPPNCSLNENAIGKGPSRLLIELRENGAGGRVITRRMSEVMKRPLVQTTVERHLKHLREAVEEPEGEEPVVRTVSDIEILDSIIVSGFRHSKNWKPTIRDTLEAMKLKSQMTGNSAFENMLTAMEAGLRESEGSDPEGPLPENPDALGDETERES